MKTGGMELILAQKYLSARFHAFMPLQVIEI